MTTFLMRRGATYYFRQRIPLDLAARMGRRELRRSLGTSNPREARSRLVHARAHAEGLFDHLRRNPMLTEEDCKFYAHWWYQHCLDEAYGWKQLAGHVPEKAAAINQDFIEGRAASEAAIIQELNRGDISRVEFHAQLALEEDGRAQETDGNSVEFRRMCHYMMRAALEATRRAKAEEAGDFAYETKDPLFKEAPPPPPAPQPPTQPPQQPVVTAEVSGPTIASLVEPFVSEKEGAGISSKTRNDYRANLALFIQFVGDRPIAAITGEEVVEFKDLLRQCPTNFRKRLGTDDLREAIRLNAERPIADRLGILNPKTINEKYLSNLKAFFDWARDNKHVRQSPAEGVRVAQAKGKAQAVDERAPFTIKELQSIFEQPNFTGPGERGHRFWAPLIALFSGMRLNEIGQLRTEEIEELHGMPHFAVREEAEDQRVKSEAGKRLVPVHPELVALGFMDYARRQKPGRLFPAWAMGNDGYYSSPFSKWFGRFLTAAKVKSPKNAFHSFRHNAADALDEVVEGRVRDKFLGHASDGVRGRYGSKPPKQVWSEAFCRLAYKGLDLSKLRPGEKGSAGRESA